MSGSKLTLYYKNVTAEIIGTEHGIATEQFRSLAEKTTPLIAELNKQRQAGRTPYRDLPCDSENPELVKKFADDIKNRCENFVVLGIGGSALGNIALQTALNSYMYNMDSTQRKGPRLFVFDNIDPTQLAAFIDYISDKLETTIFNVISKSGQTAETAAQFLVIKKLIEQTLGTNALKDRIIATTDPKDGTLRKIAKEAGFQTLPVPAGVGGRFSVLSPVGLLSAAVCGIDIDDLLAGARDMDRRVSRQDFYKNPAAINAAINWHYYNRGKKISVMMPYAYALKDFADWHRQLWAESLGKADDLAGSRVNVGPTPVKALGTTDQHSQVQLYRHGPNDKLFTFLQVNNFDRDLEIGAAPACAPELDYLAGAKMSSLLNNEKIATEYALLQDHRPCLTVNFDTINAHAVGQFIYLFETTTSIAGLLFNINTYDQPAVELGKEAAFALMNRPGYEDLAAKIQPVKNIDENFLI
ncbi:MAG: glucose-6-phosphate isomerase [Planctomycetota bacterium]